MAEIVAFTGQSFDAVWHGMTWRDYRALDRQWRKWPPPAVSLAVLAKLAPQLRDGGASDASDPALTEQNLQTLTTFIGAPPPQG